MKRLLVGLAGAALVLAVGGTASATSKAGTSLVLLPPRCLGSTCNNGKPVVCNANADCSVGAMSPSKWSISGALFLKASIKKVLDASGTPVTTDGTLGSPDDYIFVLCLRAFIPGPVDACVYVHVELKNGNGKIALDASPLGTLFGAGGVAEIQRAELLPPPADPSMCPGNNDTTDAMTFITNQTGVPTNPACETGGMLAVGGIVNGS